MLHFFDYYEIQTTLSSGELNPFSLRVLFNNLIVLPRSLRYALVNCHAQLTRAIEYFQ